MKILYQWNAEQKQCNANILYRGLDTLCLTFPVYFKGEEFKQMMAGLSINSPQKFNVDFLNYEFNIIYNLTKDKRILNIITLSGALVMTIEQYLNTHIMNGELNISFSVEFKGAFFNEDLDGFFINFINKYGDECIVRRCDLCIDLESDIQAVYASMVSNMRSREFSMPNGKLETIYVGKRTENKRHFIRIYDKIQDTLDKRKFNSYGHYLKLKNVTRIEIQINIATCKLLGINLLMCKEFLLKNQSERKNTVLWKMFEHMCFNLNQTSFLISGNEVYLEKMKKCDNKTLMEKSKYIKVFIGYAKRLSKMGIDVKKLLSDNKI